MTKTSTCCDAGRLPEGDDDLIDFHTHILPRIDDGSGSSQESLELLAHEKEQGVDRIVFTPHFYAGKDSVENFLDRREKSYQRLLFRMEEKGIEPPVFYKGAEVLFRRHGQSGDGSGALYRRNEYSLIRNAVCTVG